MGDELVCPKGASIKQLLRVAPNATVEGFSRPKFDLEALTPFNIPLTLFRQTDFTILTGSPTGAHLGVTGGTFGTDAPQITSGDVKATTVTRYAMAVLPLPDNYEATGRLTLRFLAGMDTTISDTSATFDVEAHRVADDGTVDVTDIVNSGSVAQDMNSLTYADLDFVIDPDTLSPADSLAIRIAMAFVDSATATAVIGRLAKATMLCDTRG